MSKKIFMFIVLGTLLMWFSHDNVSALTSEKNIYYTNKYQVQFTEQEYNFFSNMYWDGYQEFITQEEFNNIKNLNLFNSKIEKKSITINPDIMTRATTITEKSRTITISRSCSSNCLVSLVTHWNSIPTVKSYDVVGARLSNSTLKTINKAMVTGNNYSKQYTSYNKKGNGFGYSIKVPNTSNVRITVSFTTSFGGKAFGSYQHSNSNISETTSQLYNISEDGSGNVFKFYGAAIGKFDNANGVNVLLS